MIQETLSFLEKIYAAAGLNSKVCVVYNNIFEGSLGTPELQLRVVWDSSKLEEPIAYTQVISETEIKAGFAEVLLRPILEDIKEIRKTL